MSDKIKSHKDLHAWQQSMDLVEMIYKLTSNFPDAEKFGLTSQLRRAAVSIPSNIAEGSGRNSQKELLHFLYIALGSLSEVETQIEIARRLEFFRDTEELNKKVKFIFILITRLISAIKTKSPSY